MTKKELSDLLLNICAIILEVDPQELDPAEELSSWGLDSVGAAMIHDLIQTRLIREGCGLSFDDFLRYETIDQLSEALVEDRMVCDGKLTVDLIGAASVKDPAQPPGTERKVISRAVKQAAAETGAFRFRELGFSAPGHKTMYNGKPVVSFASNDYLSLVTDPGVRSAAEKALRDYGTGCGSSMLGSGSLAIHDALSDELADFLYKESVLLLPAGYMAMLGFCSGKIIAGQSLFCDALNHRSIIDGLRLGKGASERKDAFHFFNHNSIKSLKQIRTVVCGNRNSGLPDIVLMEGVYSMDGDRSALGEFAPYCKAEGIQVAVDDAHGIGVLGRNGRGTVDEFRKSDDVDYILGTFSKSFAASGGFIAGSEDAIDELRQQCSQYMFSASLTPPVVETVRYILKLIQKDNRRQLKLWDNIDYFRSCLSDLAVETMGSDSAIFPVLVNSEERALACARRLVEENGIFVLPVIYPVVPKNKARLRISINAGHSRSDIGCLAESLAKILSSTTQ